MEQPLSLLIVHIIVVVIPTKFRPIVYLTVAARQFDKKCYH